MATVMQIGGLLADAVGILFSTAIIRFGSRTLRCGLKKAAHGSTALRFVLLLVSLEKGDGLVMSGCFSEQNNCIPSA